MYPCNSTLLALNYWFEKFGIHCVEISGLASLIAVLPWCLNSLTRIEEFVQKPSYSDGRLSRKGLVPSFGNAEYAHRRVPKSNLQLRIRLIADRRRYTPDSHSCRPDSGACRKNSTHWNVQNGALGNLASALQNCEFGASPNLGSFRQQFRRITRGI